MDTIATSAHSSTLNNPNSQSEEKKHFFMKKETF